ncbi:MAG: RibD family protein [Thermoplasmata archaeon]
MTREARPVVSRGHGPGPPARRLRPFSVLFDRSHGRSVPLPEPIEAIYGPLRLASGPQGPLLLGNSASTLDGVAALSRRGPSGGGDITGFDPGDRMLMGLLRAVADVVVVGAGTLRAVPRHLWTAARAYPPMAPSFAELRERLGKPPAPLTVIVTASGRVDLDLPVFTSGAAPVLVATTPSGVRRLHRAACPPGLRVVAAARSGRLSPKAILGALDAVPRPGIVLVEGGPHLMAGFLAAGRLDELFLTLAPQIAGRTDAAPRLGFVAGHSFAPRHPLWGTLVGVRRGESHLFLRFDLHGGARRPLAHLPPTDPAPRVAPPRPRARRTGGEKGI